MSEQVLRRYWWGCVCGAPCSAGTLGMREGPQYVSAAGADTARRAHALACRSWSVVLESPCSPVSPGSVP